jgi:hypothetical protein
MINDDLITKTLALINKSQVVQDHFFNSINNPEWLKPLEEKGLFAKPTKEIRKDGYIQFPYWSAGQYLVRVADKAQDEVLEIVKALPDTDNERVMTNVAEILLKIDAAKAVEAVDKIKEYIKKPQYLLFGNALADLIVKLANEGATKEAIELATLALEVTSDPEAEGKTEDDFVWLHPVTRYRDHDYEELVKKITPALAGAAPDRAASMYANLLDNAIRYNERKIKTLDEVKDEDTIQDISLIWRPVIEEEHVNSSEPRHRLIDAFIESLQALVESDKISDEAKAKQLRGILGMKLETIKRCVEYALRGKELTGDLKAIHDTLYAEFKKIIKQPAVRFSGEFDTVIGDSGVTQEEFEALDDDALLEKLKTYEPSSSLFSDREALGSNLETAAKNDPDRFITLLPKIANTKYLYLNSVINTFWTNIDNLSAEQIGKIATALTPIFNAEPRETDESRDYYKWARSSATRFVEKAFDKVEGKNIEYITATEADAVLDLVLILTRDIEPTLEYESDKKRNLDPTSLSINSIRGQAMHALIHAMAWANRNKAGSKFMNKIFVELDWHLVKDNDPTQTIRAVYGWHFPMMWGNREEWAMSNKDVIFSNDELGQIAADAYVSFSRVHPDAIRILGDVFERQIPRLAAEPDKKKRSGVAAEGLKHLVQHLSLHYWYGQIDLSNGSIMKKMLDTAHTKHLSEVINFIGFRLYKADENKLEVTAKELKRLSDLWEYVVKLAKKDSSKKEALEEFGTWFASGKFNDDWSLDQLLEALRIAGSVNLDFAVLERLEKLVATRPAKAVSIIDAMVDGATRDRWAIGTWRDNAVSILKAAYNSDNTTTKQAAMTLANKLVNKGYEEYRSVTK